MLLHDPLIKRAQHRLHCFKLRRQHNDARPCIDRQTCILLVGHDRKQFLHPLVSLRSHDAELSQMCAQCIDHLSALAHQQIARAMLRQLPLLLSRLDPHKAHRRTPNRFADRRRIGGIVLVALKVSLHILRRHQPHLVAELRQLARPIMRGGTRLHPDQARRKSREKR